MLDVRSSISDLILEAEAREDEALRSGCRSR